MIGNFALDDPEGQERYEKLYAEVKSRKDVKLTLDRHDIFVNVIQRTSNVVLQMSLKEVLLSVSEAL